MTHLSSATSEIWKKASEEEKAYWRKQYEINRDQPNLVDMTNPVPDIVAVDNDLDFEIFPCENRENCPICLKYFPAINMVNQHDDLVLDEIEENTEIFPEVNPDPSPFNCYNNLDDICNHGPNEFCPICICMDHLYITNVLDPQQSMIPFTITTYGHDLDENCPTCLEYYSIGNVLNQQEFPFNYPSITLNNANVTFDLPNEENIYPENSHNVNAVCSDGEFSDYINYGYCVDDDNMMI